MNDVAMPIRPNSDQASTTDAGRTTSRRGGSSRSVVRSEGVSISIGGISRLTGGKSGGLGAADVLLTGVGGLKKVGGGAAGAGRSTSGGKVAGVTETPGSGPVSGVVAGCPTQGAGSGSRGSSGARVTPRKNSASTRRSSGRRSIRSAGMAAAASSRSPRPAGLGGDSVEVEAADALPTELDCGSPGAGESGAGTTRSALHRGHDTIEPAFPGAEARSWLH
jgi:hypothetical protein